MTSNNTVIVFAPGAWHQATCFDKLRNALKPRGWTTVAVEYPSVGAEPPTKHVADDAAAIRSAVLRLADEGKEVVLVVHSYGGLAGAVAVEGLGWKQRAKQGKIGGVTMFIYLAAFVTPLGKSIKEMLGGQFLPWMNFTSEPYVFADKPEEVFYHDLSPEELKQALAEIRHQSAPVFTDVVGYEPWHEMPCGYIVCDEDKALPPPVQEQMASMLGPKAFVAHIQSSHSPFVSRVQECVDALEKAAELGHDKITA
ncbi:alpha/beta-hydrolase [Coniochaeta ligniaria NRRL 30616]|uniref:Alpha/beta-hydrolase n=1 Tax=Coniochaeta ligniaria NRRL 30616 TaxID=1408157 RepID=A0A1J7K094_9PEZI|nr:alpha/beta-hydrolase [Coniochaeta ligniaria NRRL 30616]